MAAPAQPLIARVLLDAQDQFAHAIEHVPDPGRGGPIGRLNSAGWIIAHTASTHDAWINRYGQGLEGDGWLAEWSARQREQPAGTAAHASFDEAREAFARVAERATPYLESCDEAELSQTARVPEGSAWHGRTKGQFVARDVAHLFAHAGELTVVASLLARGDLGLPGRLTRSTRTGREATEAAGATAAQPLIVRMLLDAREEFARVVEAVPVPAQVAAFRRLNAGGWIVAHLALQDDHNWNVGAQQLEPDAWLTSASATYGASPSAPDFAEARAALDRSYARSRPYLEGLDSSQLDDVVRRSENFGDQTVSDLIVRQLAHYFALAGELSAIASLAGAPDLGLPDGMHHAFGPAA